MKLSIQVPLYTYLFIIVSLGIIYSAACLPLASSSRSADGSLTLVFSKIKFSCLAATSRTNLPAFNSDSFSVDLKSRSIPLLPGTSQAAHAIFSRGLRGLPAVYATIVTLVVACAFFVGLYKIPKNEVPQEVSFGLQQQRQML